MFININYFPNNLFKLFLSTSMKKRDKEDYMLQMCTFEERFIRSKDNFRTIHIFLVRNCLVTLDMRKLSTDVTSINLSIKARGRVGYNL